MFKLINALLLSVLLSFSFAAGAQTTEEIQQLAEEGDALGQAKLASLYLLGRNGVELDNIKAAKWMTKAADQDLVEAQVVLGAMNDRGMGVAANPKKATEWYEKAAKQGHGTSLAILGRNPTAKGSVKFSYQGMRLNAGRQIPKEYAKRFLMQK